MNDFLKSRFQDIQNLKKEKLPGDGGHREYFRIKSKGQSFMLMSCGKKDPSLESFIAIQKRLAPFATAPKIFQEDKKKGFLLLEDLGDLSLERFFFQKGFKLCLPFYHQTLKELIALQSKVKPLKTDLIFNKEFLLKEIDKAVYHMEFYINRLCGKKLFNEKSSKGFKTEMQKLLDQLKPEDYVFCHRDYHSRNLMIKNKQVIMIDFQDAGLGPWHYDLTSLLYDSYIPLAAKDKQELSCFYFQALPAALKNKARSPAHIERMTKLMFLQRGFKACGCFALFKNLNQKNRHLKYIPPTLDLLKETASELSCPEISKYTTRAAESLKEAKSPQPCGKTPV